MSIVIHQSTAGEVYLLVENSITFFGQVEWNEGQVDQLVWDMMKVK